MENNDVTMFQSSLPKRQVIIALTGTLLSMFLSSLYMTVIATAMPRIITDLGGFRQYTWVFTSFFIAEVMMVPLAGKLSDRYGRKWFYVFSLILFVLGSFLSGISQTMTQLIIFRVLQGLGCGVMMSLSFIVIADLFPPSERGKYGGLMAGVFAVSTIIGPVIGGYLTDYLSWRWCFFINIPIGILIIFLFIFFYPQYRSGYTGHKVDYAGAALMILGIVPLMLALTWGGTDYEWLSPNILGLLGFSAAMFIIFFINESRAEEPVVPLWLFKNRVVAVSSIVVFVMGATFMPAVTFIPLYFQGVQGVSASLSGNFLMPMMLSMTVGSFLCGQAISRSGGYYRLQSTIGIVILAVGLFLFSGATVETGYVTAIAYIVLIGFGSGILMPIHVLAVQNSVPYAIMGTATAAVTWLRIVGGLVGLSVVGSVMNNRFSAEFMGNLSSGVKAAVSPEKLASMVNNPQALVNPEARAQLQAMFEGLGTQGTTLFDQMLATLQNALNSALTEIFAALFGLAVIALIANLFLKGIPPHRRIPNKPSDAPGSQLELRP